MVKFFEFRQNNSGGSFDQDENVDQFVIIEAASPDHANARAQEIGIYFDGCSDGRDCSCCGDRWYPLWDSEKGSDEPSLYGEPIADYESWFGGRAIIHRLDGSKESVPLKPRQAS